ATSTGSTGRPHATRLKSAQSTLERRDARCQYTPLPVGVKSTSDPASNLPSPHRQGGLCRQVYAPGPEWAPGVLIPVPHGDAVGSTKASSCACSSPYSSS